MNDVYDLKGVEKQGAFKFVNKQTNECSPFYCTRENQSLAHRIEEELALLLDGLHPVSDLQEAFDASTGAGLYVIIIDYFYSNKENHSDFISRIDKKYYNSNGIKMNPFKKRIK